MWLKASPPVRKVLASILGSVKSKQYCQARFPSWSNQNNIAKLDFRVGQIENNIAKLDSRVGQMENNIAKLDCSIPGSVKSKTILPSSIPGSVKSKTLLPRARHRYDVSSELCCPGTKPRRWIPPHSYTLWRNTASMMKI